LVRTFERGTANQTGTGGLEARLNNNGLASDADRHVRRNGYEQELLHFAAQHGDLSQIERIIVDGSDVNAFDSLGMTPLHWAAKGEHLNVVAFLIKYGADVNAHHEPSIGDTPLGAVAGNCSFEMARLLVDAGADPSIRG
jgi:ankyrin repeat protein